MALFLNSVLAIVCLFVIGASICRMDMMHSGKNKMAWFAFYLTSALFAFGMVLDLFHDVPIPWHRAAGVLALALQIINTGRLWRGGPPAITLKGKP